MPWFDQDIQFSLVLESQFSWNNYNLYDAKIVSLNAQANYNFALARFNLENF